MTDLERGLEVDQQQVGMDYGFWKTGFTLFLEPDNERKSVLKNKKRCFRKYEKKI